MLQALQQRLLKLARKFGYRTAAEKQADYAAYQANLADEERRNKERQAAREVAEAAEQKRAAAAECVRVQEEIEAARAKGERFIRLTRTNDHWQDAVIAFANAHHQTGLTVQFFTYWVPGHINCIRGEWLVPQRALLTFPKV